MVRTNCPYNCFNVNSIFGVKMEKITSVNNTYIKELMLLNNKKTRDEKKLFLVEGYHLVNEAYMASKLECVLITREEDELANIRNILVNESIIDKLSTSVTPQKIIGVCRGGYSDEIKGDRFVLLDGVSDPGNIGTIIRSAVGFKVDQIILSKESCDCYNSKVLRSTQGGIFNVGLVKMDLTKAIEQLKKMGVKVIGTSLTGDNISDFSSSRYALVLGNEAHGVQSDIQALCDQNVLIKTEPALESLNVGVAGSIMMYELYKSIDK